MHMKKVIQLSLAASVLPLMLAGISPAFSQSQDGQSQDGQSQNDDPVVAIINDYEIKASDINAEISKMPLGDQVSVRSDPEKFAESLIQEEVLFQFAFKNGFADEPELRKELKTLAVNFLINKYVTQKMVVTDEEIQEYYDANPGAISGETVQVNQILTETRDECEALMQRLDAGESFAELAKTHSIHETSAANNGVLGSIMNHEGPLGFEQDLFEIPHNEYTLFESTDGCHLIEITGRQTPAMPPVENVAPAIRNLLLREKEIEAVQGLIESANSVVKVVRP